MSAATEREGWNDLAVGFRQFTKNSLTYAKTPDGEWGWCFIEQGMHGPHITSWAPQAKVNRLAEAYLKSCSPSHNVEPGQVLVNKLRATAEALAKLTLAKELLAKEALAKEIVPEGSNPRKRLQKEIK